jgi:hypothetical protein
VNVSIEAPGAEEIFESASALSGSGQAFQRRRIIPLNFISQSKAFTDLAAQTIVTLSPVGEERMARLHAAG